MFILYIAFTVMVVMNLVTGVFVEGAKRQSEDERQNQFLRQTQNVFDIVGSKTASGRKLVTWQDFSKNLAHPTVQNFFDRLQIDISQAKNLFKLLDDRGGL